MKYKKELIPAFMVLITFAYAVDDGVVLYVSVSGNDIVLTWSGGAGRYAVTQSPTMGMTYNVTTLVRDTTATSWTITNPSGTQYQYEALSLDSDGNPVSLPRSGYLTEADPTITDFEVGGSPSTLTNHGDTVRILGGPFDALYKNNLVQLGPFVLTPKAGNTTYLDVDVPSHAFSAYLSVMRPDGRRTNLLPLNIACNDEDFADISSTAFNPSPAYELFVADRTQNRIWRMSHSDPLNPSVCIVDFAEPVISRVTDGRVFYASGSSDSGLNDRNVRYFNTSDCSTGLFASAVDGADGTLLVKARGIGAASATGPVYYYDGTTRLVRRIPQTGAIDKDFGDMNNFCGGCSYFYPGYPAGAHYSSPDGSLWVTGNWDSEYGLLWVIVGTDETNDAIADYYWISAYPRGFDFNDEYTNLRYTTSPDRDVKYAEVAETRHAYMAASSATTVFHNQDIDIQISPIRDTRVLISSKQGGPYLTSLQTADAQITLQVKSFANTTVYLRALDPPDTAPYIPSEPEPPWGDNADIKFGFDEARTIKTTSVTTGSDGYAYVTLYITTQYAGDNYKVQASFQAFAGTDYKAPGARVKAETGVITAWKRVYVEHDWMFRFGAFLVSDAVKGADRVAVDTLSVDQFQIGDRIRIIGNSDSGAVEYREEEHVIGDISANSLVFDGTTLRYNYFEKSSHLSDAVGVVARDGLTLFDLYYTARPELTWEAFPEAFTEIRFFEEGRFGVAPKWRYEEGKGLDFAHKWFNLREAHNAQGNIFHLIGAENSAGLNLNGVADIGQASGDYAKSNATYIFVAQLENYFSGTNLASAIRETTVHEFGHQFWVNTKDRVGDPPQLRGHCSQNMYDRALKCAMHDVQDQILDGITDFDNDDSAESVSRDGKGDIYDIRWVKDPIPHLEADL